MLPKIIKIILNINIYTYINYLIHIIKLRIQVIND